MKILQASRKMAMCVAVATLCVTHAAAQSTPFNFSYDANALPQNSAPAWIKVIDSDPSGPMTSETVSNGILTVFTGSKADYLEYQMPGGNGLNWNPTGAGSTLEVRLKTDFNTAEASLAGNLVIGTGSRAWVLGVGENQISELAGGGTYPINTKDAFHTLRFTIADEVNGSLAMYVDGANSPAAFWKGVPSAANRISFGDTTNASEGGQIQWDFLRWTNNGKYAPATVLPKSGDAGFGRQWLRERPLTVMGEVIDVTPGGYQVTPFSTSKYLGLNMNTVFSFQSQVIVDAAARAGIDWHMAINVPPGQYLTQSNKTTINQLVAKGHSTGWYLPDEPRTQADLIAAADYARWMNANHPDLLVYLNVYQNDVSFLNNVVTRVRPDLLMFDQYPFRANGSTDTNAWFSMLMNVRQVCQANQIPYGGWLQSFHLSGWDLRTPSESDTRYNAYTLLTAGYSMLNYYVYDDGPATSVISTFLDSNGNPTPMYNYAGAANKEYTTLGKTLRFLKSTEVRFVPGKHTIAGSVTGPNTTPSGLVNWSANAGGDPHLQSLTVSGGQLGTEKNGLIGFFTDEDGADYFFLTNLYHGASLSAAAASLNFDLTFDSTINELLRLNRITGEQEVIPLSNHQLIWTLPGGTGDLFKYNFGDFIGQGWCMDASGDWNDADNWGGALPNAVGAKAMLGDVLRSARTIYTDSAVTVGMLRFKSASTYQIAGNGSLTMDVASGAASILVLSGSHKINLPLFLNDNTTANVMAGATLKISNPMTLVGNVILTKTGNGTLSIEAPVFSASPATIASAAGVLSVMPDLGQNTSLRISGGTTTLGATQHLASVDVSGGLLQLGVSRGIVTKQLSLTGDGKLDLANGRLVVDYTDASVIDAVRSAIQTQNLTSSLLSPGLAIGYGEASDLFGNSTGSFYGEWVDSGSVLVAFTVTGDASLDGTVNSTDFNLLAAHYGQTAGARWTQGDFDGDGKVSTLDFNLLAGNYSQTVSWDAALGGMVPEPSSMVIFIIGVGMAVQRRRV